MSKVTRASAIAALVALIVSQGMTTAVAASPEASCVGIIVSTEAQAGVLDVRNYKAIAESQEAPTFGQFVAQGAKLHFGSVEDCFP
ncbi:hypothetical protein [Arthrobacter rhizosphaerae]|uniref:hypothetical protein n=1 Tax=Arthrobacter rhizosphaerae TaxID=2855490 RepID=UPI001FF1BFAD|nr:hypothetical protein [Arthrobacter rhizosphaerae]